MQDHVFNDFYLFEEEKKYHLFPYFITSICESKELKFIHNWIETEYKKKPETYFYHAKSSPFFHFFYFGSGSLKKEFLAKKTLGIMSYSIENDQALFCEFVEQIINHNTRANAIIQKSECITEDTWNKYQDLINLSVNESKRFTNFEMYAYYMQKKLFSTPQLNDGAFLEFIVFLFVCKCLKKEINMNEFEAVDELFMAYINLLNKYNGIRSIAHIVNEKERTEKFKTKKELLSILVEQKVANLLTFDEEEQEVTYKPTSFDVGDIIVLYKHLCIRYGLSLPCTLEEMGKKQLEKKSRRYNTRIASF